MTRDESIARLHPDFLAMADWPQVDLRTIPLDDVRAASALQWTMLGAPDFQPPAVILAPGLAGGPEVAVRAHTPPDGPVRLAILHIHGGGMVMGNAASLDAMMAAMAARLGALIASVEYRLAPETPFPGPLLDCAAGWAWLRDHAGGLGLGPQNCVVTGESAGAGLAAALCLYLRDTGGPMPAGQVLTYPMLDHRTGAGDEDTDHRIGWTSANNQFGWKALLGDQSLPHGDSLGHYSPACAQSLAGLPPMWIGVGSLDLFYEENIAFAARMARAGGDVTLLTVPGVPHSFQVMPSPVSKRFLQAQRAAFLRFARHD